MLNNFKYFLTFFYLFLCLICVGQDPVTITAKSNHITFPSPAAWRFSNYGNYPVSYYTGNINVNLELFRISQNGLELPISLDYNFLENKPSTIPSKLGLGFSLTAGGMITRVVKGTPDDLNGFIQSSGSKDFYETNKDMYLNEVINRRLDNEPDVFYYKFGDFNGSFYFKDKSTIILSSFNNLKIVPIFNNAGISGFDIITSEGIKYSFLDFESSNYKEPLFGAFTQYNSSWHLTKITLRNSSTIDFEYYPYVANNPGGNVLTGYTEGFEGGVAYAQAVNSLDNSFVKSTEYYERYLKTIRFSTGTIEFIMSNRMDRGGKSAKKISDIKLFNLDNSLIKSFKLLYLENEEERLKLSKIYQIANGEEHLFREFVYNQVKLPWNPSDQTRPYYSNQVDYWGYYNGEIENNYRSPIPRIAYNGELYGSSIRTANLNYALAEILEKEIYPTKGYTEFKYELHDFSKQGDSYSPYQIEKLQSFNYEFEYEAGEFFDDPYQISFSLPNATLVRVFKSKRGAGTNTKWIINGDSEAKDIVLNAGTYNFGTLLNANYLLHSDNSDILTARGSISFSTLVNTPIGLLNNGKGGGIRISKIINFDNGKVREKKYIYRKELVSESSSGILSLMPTYLINNQHLISNLQGVFYSSTPILGYNESENVGYSTVFELDDDGSYKKYSYSTINEFPDEIVSYDLNGVKEELLPRVSNKDLRGRLLKEEFFTSSNKLIKKIEYKNEELKDNRAKSLHIVLVHPTFPVLRYYADGGSYYDRLSTTMNSVFIKKFPFLPLSQTITTLYSDRDSSKSIIKYEYNNDLYSFPTDIKRINSKNEESWIFQTYPLDYQNSFNSMIEKNYLNFPIEKVLINKTNDRAILDGTINLYDDKGNLKEYHKTEFLTPQSSFKFSNLESGIFPPNKNLGLFSKDPKYVKISELKSVDTYGNPLEIKYRSESNTVYLWGYRGQYPIAEIKNATYAEVVAVLTQAVIDNLNLAMNTEATMETLIKTAADKLRTSLPNAMVTNYTYKPLVGMTSKTDPRGIKETYKYDGMQRLQAILDHLNYVNKSFDYHYRPN